MAMIKTNSSVTVNLFNEKFDSLNARLDTLEAQNNEIISLLKGTDKAPIGKKESKGTKGTKSDKATKTSKATKKSDSEVVERYYINATRRLEKAEFNKVYEIVKKYDGRIKNSDKKDSKGQKLAMWSFTRENGIKFANEVADKKVFGRKAIPLKSELVVLK